MVAVVTEEEHVKALLAIAHLPLLDESVKPEPKSSVHCLRVPMWEGNIPLVVAVMVAQVPEVYHVPALIIHPVCDPPLITLTNPLPDGLPVEVEVGAVVVVPVAEVEVVVETPEDPLGRYLIPEDGQVDPDPTGVAALNVPL